MPYSTVLRNNPLEIQRNDKKQNAESFEKNLFEKNLLQ